MSSRVMHLAKLAVRRCALVIGCLLLRFGVDQ
jgi:hypothetical protein